MEDKLVRSFTVGSDTYHIPEAEANDFLKDMPDAKEVKSFTDGKDTYAIPLPEIENFMKDMPEVKPAHAYSEIIPKPAEIQQPLNQAVPASEPVKKEETGFWSTWAGDALQKVGAGATNMIGGLAGFSNLPIKIYANVVAKKEGLNAEDRIAFTDAFLDVVPTTKQMQQLKESTKAVSQRLSQKADRYTGKDFTELWKQGDYSSAVGDVFLQGAESLPTMITAMVGGAGLIPIALQSMSDKYDQLDNPQLPTIHTDQQLKDFHSQQNMGEFMKVLNAAVSGTSEALTEKLGSVPTGKWIKGMYSSLGKEGAKEAFEKGIGKWTSDMFNKFGLILGPVSEGVEEYVNQVVNNVTDYATGATTKFEPTKDAGKMFVYGMGGGMFGTPVEAGLMIANKIQQRNQNNTPTAPVTADSTPIPTIDPRSQAEQQANIDFESMADKTTGNIKKVYEVTPEGEKNIEWLVDSFYDDPAGKIVYFVKDPTGQIHKRFTSKEVAEKRGEEPNEITRDEYVGAKLQDYDLTEQNKQLIQRDQFNFNGKVYQINGDQAKDGGYEAFNIDDDSDWTSIPASSVDKIRNIGEGKPNIVTRVFGKTEVAGTMDESGNISVSDPMTFDQLEQFKEDVKNTTNGKSQVIPKLIPGTDPTLPDQYEVVISPTQTGTQGQDATTLGTSADVPGPAYSLNGQEITKEEAHKRVNKAILLDDKSKLNGLAHSDQEISDKIDKKWPKPPAVFKIKGKKINPKDALDFIEVADDMSELNELKYENINSEPAVKEALEKRKYELTPQPTSFPKEFTEPEFYQWVAQNHKDPALRQEAIDAISRNGGSPKIAEQYKLYKVDNRNNQDYLKRNQVTENVNNSEIKTENVPKKSDQVNVNQQSADLENANNSHNLQELQKESKESLQNAISVPLSLINPTEGHTPETTIRKHSSRNPEEPIRVSFDKKGKLNIEDGNHRFFEAVERGDKNINIVFGTQLSREEQEYQDKYLPELLKALNQNEELTPQPQATPILPGSGEIGKNPAEEIQGQKGLEENVREIDSEFGRGSNDIVKKYITMMGPDALNIGRLVSIARNIQKIDGTNTSGSEAISEALQYEYGFIDNWNDLRGAVEKGGIELNKPSIERMLSVGVILPEDITNQLQTPTPPTGEQLVADTSLPKGGEGVSLTPEDYRGKPESEGKPNKYSKKDIIIAGIDRNDLPEKEWDSILGMANNAKHGEFILPDENGIETQTVYSWKVNKPKTETGHVLSPEEQAKLTHNALIGLVEKFNATAKNKINIRSKIQLQILQTAQRLGKDYKIETSPQRDITLLKDGKKARRIGTKQSKDEINAHPLLSEYPQPVQDFYNRLNASNSIEFLDIPTIIPQGVRDIQAGKKSVAANDVLDHIERMFTEGVVKLRGTLNNAAEHVDIEHYFATFEQPLSDEEHEDAMSRSDDPAEHLWEVSAYYDLTPEQTEEIDNLFIDYGHESQIDTRAKDSDSPQSPEPETAGITSEEVQPEVKTLTPLEQQIADLNEEKKSLLKEKEAKLNQANTRNGLFGDTKSDPNDLFGRQGFDPAEGLKQAQKITDRISAIDKQIEYLTTKVDDVKATAAKENAGQQEIVAPEAVNQKLSKDNIEIKPGDYVIYGVDPRTRGFNSSQLTPYLQKVTGFREIGGLIYPTFDVPKGSKKSNFGYTSAEYTIIPDAEQLLNPDKSTPLTEVLSGAANNMMFAKNPNAGAFIEKTGASGNKYGIYDPDAIKQSEWDAINRGLTKKGFLARPTGDWKTYFHEKRNKEVNEDQYEVFKKVLSQKPEVVKTDLQKFITKAKRYFGTTNNFSEAGYLLQDGSMLDFSGRRQGNAFPQGRSLDHREIGSADENSDVDMVSFMAEGNIRMKSESDGFEVTKEPTNEQIKTLRAYIQSNQQSKNFQGILVDYSTPGDYDTLFSTEYGKSVPASRILNDILNYYRTGIKPIVSNGMRFSIIGERGASKIEGLVDNLTTAKEMTEAGKNPKTIFLATGWEKFPDGWKYDKVDDLTARPYVDIFKFSEAVKARKEIDRLNREKDYSTERTNLIKTLQDFYGSIGQSFVTSDQGIHTAIQEALRNSDQSLLPKPTIEGKIKYLNQNVLGRAKLFDVIADNELFKMFPELKKVTVSIEDTGGNLGEWNRSTKNISISNRLKGSEGEITSTLAHEIQHAIQDIEGFAKGGNYNVVKQKRGELYDKVTEYNTQLSKASTDRDMALYDKLLNERSEVVKELQKFPYDARDIHTGYKRLAGETESRNVQSRLNLTPEERMTQLLSETQDVAEDQKIYLQGEIEKAYSIEGPEEVQKTVDRLEAGAIRKNTIHVLNKDETIRHLESNPKKYTKETVESVKNHEFEAIQIDDDVFINSDIIKDKDSAIKKWMHEKTHTQIFNNYPIRHERDTIFEAIYDIIGEREIKRVVPSLYWNDPRSSQAQEYMAFASEQLFDGKFNRNINEDAKEYISDLVGKFTTLKNIEDVKHNRDLQRNGAKEPNPDNGNSNGGPPSEDTGTSREGAPNINGSLRQNEARGGLEDATTNVSVGTFGNNRKVEPGTAGKGSSNKGSEAGNSVDRGDGQADGQSSGKSGIDAKNDNITPTFQLGGTQRDANDRGGKPGATGQNEGTNEQGGVNFRTGIFKNDKGKTTGRTIPLTDYLTQSKEHITVDGISRPTLNSNGKPIHPTKEGIVNFWKWFGDSKVVDEQGRPLVVYHSTKNDFDTFKKRGLSKGFFFSKSSMVNMTPRLWDSERPYSDGSTIIPVYLSVKNIKSIEGNGDPYFENIEIEAAKKQKYDGILLNESTYVAFSPSQIKSATGNRGTFDSSDNSILSEPQNNLENSDVSLLNEKKRTYKTKDGETIQYSLFSDSESSTTDGPGAGDVQREDRRSQNPSLRRLEPGEMSAVERKYTIDKNFVFSGSNKIESTDDVAYLFRKLEDKSVENIFACLVKNGKPTIIHVSMGGQFRSLMEMSVLSDAISRFSPDKVYLVHNHPSGNLDPSDADYTIHQSAINTYGDLIGEHIIIDITSGFYTTFRERFDGTTEQKFRPRSTETEVSYKTLQFDKQVFKQNTVLPLKISSARDIASFVSQQRFTEGNKLSVLILNRQNAIVAVVHYPSFDITNGDAIKAFSNDVLAYTSRFGGNGIIISDNRYSQLENDWSTRKGYQALKRNLADASVTLQDIVSVSPLRKDVYSLANEGLLEPSVPYEPREVNDPGKSQPLTEYLKTAAERYEETRKTKRTFTEIREKLREAFQDMDLPVRRMEEEIKRLGGVIKDNMKPYRDMSLMYGRTETLYKDFHNNTIKPIIKSVSKLIKSGISGEEILPYTIAKRATELNPQKRQEELDAWIEENPEAGQEETDAFAETLSKKDYSGVTPLGDMTQFETPDELAQAIVYDFERKADPALVKELWDNIKVSTNFLLDTWVKSNSMSPKEAEQIREKSKYYVPLRGWREGAAKQLLYTKGEGFSKSLQRAEGRRSLADNPLAYIEKVGFQAIGEQTDNEVKESLLNLVKENYGGDFKKFYELRKAYYILQEDPVTGEQEWILSLDRPSEELFKEGKAKTKLYGEYMKLRTPSQARENEILVKRSTGDIVLVMKDEYLTVAQAMNHKNKMYRELFTGRPMDADFWNKPTGRVLGGLVNLQKAMYTSYNIVFPFTNFLRDVPEAAMTQMIKGDDGHKLFGNVGHAFPALIKSFAGKPGTDKYSTYLTEFRENGGNTGWTHSLTPEQIEEKLTSMMNILVRKGTVRGATLDNLRHVIGGIELWNQLFEDATRLGVFITSREMGKSAKEAAIDAKEASVNFNRKGKLSKAFDAIWAFFNVSIQSAQKNLGLAKHYPKAFTGAAVAWIALGFFEALMNEAAEGDGDDEKYANITPWVRANYLILPNLYNLATNGKGNNRYIRIPLPQFWRGFKSVGSLMYEVQQGRVTPLKAIAQGTTNFLSSLTPFDIPGLYQNGEINFSPIAPTALKPFVELAENRDFTGSQIYRVPFTKKLEEDTADSQLGKKNVSPVIKMVTDAMFRMGGGDSDKNFSMRGDEIKNVPPFLDINPSKIEHILTGYTGGTGRFVSDVMTTAFQGITHEPLDPHNIPFINTFIKNIPEAKWGVIDKFNKLGQDYNVNKFETLKQSYLNNLKKMALSSRDIDEAEAKFVNTAGNAFYNEYSQVLKVYQDRLDSQMKEMDFKTAEGSEDIMATMNEAVNEIKQIKLKYNKP